MAGILSYGSYVPYFRLQRQAIGAGKGERAVASFDEDAVSMAVEAARGAGIDGVEDLFLATTNPPYVEKLNAATVQAALGLSPNLRSADFGGTARAGLGALLCGLDAAAAGRTALVCLGDVSIGAPGGPRETMGGDAAAAFRLGSDEDSIARLIGRASATTELLDTWRGPGDVFPRQWEERFAAEVLGPVVADVVVRALRDAGTEPGQLSSVVIDASNAKVGMVVPKVLKLQAEQIADPLAAGVGRAGAAHAGLVLARALDTAKPGERILVVSVSDGADAAVFEVTEAIDEGRAAKSVDSWIASKRNDLAYNTYLKWRGVLPFEPPRRPDPERPAAPPSRRHQGWKFRLEGSRCESCGTGHLPPQRVCVTCAATDQMKVESFSERTCKIATYTIDHLAYTLQPPTVAAVADFEGGGRFTTELTDVEPEKVAIGDELEMTFRRLFAADGVSNYFWKARPRR